MEHIVLYPTQNNCRDQSGVESSGSPDHEDSKLHPRNLFSPQPSIDSHQPMHQPGLPEHSAAALNLHNSNNSPLNGPAFMHQPSTANTVQSLHYSISSNQSTPRSPINPHTATEHHVPNPHSLVSSAHLQQQQSEHHHIRLRENPKIVSPIPTPSPAESMISELNSKKDSKEKDTKIRHRINDISDQIQKIPCIDSSVAPSPSEKLPFPNCSSVKTSILPSAPPLILHNITDHGPSPGIEKTSNGPKISPTRASSPSPDIKNTATNPLIPSSSDPLPSSAMTSPKPSFLYCIPSFPSYIECAKSESKSPKSQKTATGLSPQG